jgi:hypothetical protein
LAIVTETRCMEQIPVIALVAATMLTFVLMIWAGQHQS